MRLFNELTKTRLRAIIMAIASTAVIAAAPAFAHSAPAFLGGSQNVSAADDEQGDDADAPDENVNEDQGEETDPEPGDNDQGQDEDQAEAGDDDQGKDENKDKDKPKHENRS